MTLWRDGAVTVVLLASTTQERTILPLVRDWTQQGLLSPSAWVGPRDITGAEGPPRVEATLIANVGGEQVLERKVDLFELLARDKIDRVRLIKLRSPSPDPEADRLQDDVSARVGKYVGLSIPQAHPAASDAAEVVELIRATLICAPTGVSLDERLSALEREVGVIVVASPEDRAVPSAGDAFVREDQRFPGFVLMNLATIAGLWSGLPAGSLELFDRESSAAQSIWIQRAFIRGVVSRGLAGGAAVGVLEGIVKGRGSIVADGVTIAPAGTTLIPRHQERDYLARLVDSAMAADDRALDFRLPGPRPEPPRQSTSIGQQMAQFAKFSWGKFTRIPHWVRLWFHDRVAKKLTSELEGSDGYREIQLQLDQKPDSFDRRLIVATARIRSTDWGSRIAIPSDVPQVSSRLWPSLRRMVFAAVDGSTSPDLDFGSINGNTPVFRDLSLISPDPKSVWMRPEGTSGEPTGVSWAQYCVDPDVRVLLTDQVAEDDAQVATLLSEQLDAGERADQARADLDEQEEALIASGALRRRSDGVLSPIKTRKGADASEVESRERDLNLWRSAVALSKATAKEHSASTAQWEMAQATLDESLAALRSFDEWLEAQASTFTLKLRARMTEARDRAQGQLEAEGEAYEPPALYELVRLRRAYHRGLIIAGGILTVLAVTVGAIVAWGHSRSSAVGSSGTSPRDNVWAAILPDWLLIALIGLAVFFAIGMVLVVVYYRGWSTFARQVQLAEHRAEMSVVRAGELRREVNRLESVHRQANEWVDLIATAMYDPWSIPPEWGVADVQFIDGSQLPFAMSIGSAVNDLGLEDRLGRDAASQLLRPGWRDRVFRILLEETARHAGVTTNALSIDALDADLPSSPNRARQMLRHHMDNDDVLRSVANRVLVGVAGHLQDAFDSSHAVKVRAFERGGPLSDFLSDEVDTLWNEFLLEPLTKAPHQVTPLSVLGISSHHIQRAHHEDVTSFVLCAESVAEEVDALRRESVVTRGVERQASDTFDALVRVDVAGPVPLEAIHAVGRQVSAATEVPQPALRTTSSGV